mgnify:CR=1 FL=1
MSFFAGYYAGQAQLDPSMSKDIPDMSQCVENNQVLTGGINGGLQGNLTQLMLAFKRGDFEFTKTSFIDIQDFIESVMKTEETSVCQGLIHSSDLDLSKGIRVRDNKLMFGDTASFIHQSADGVLDLVSDTEIEINATTIDMNGTVDMSAGLTVGGSATLSSVAALTMAANDSTHHILVTDSDDNIVKKESYQDLISGSAGLGLRVNATSKKLEVAAIEDHFMSGNVGGTGGQVFTLSATPVSGSVMVFINGIFQVQAGSHATIGAGDYAVSGQTITLVAANIVDAEDEVVVKYILA